MTFSQKIRLNGGFTLIELLVVLFIVSIVITLAVLAVGKGIQSRALTTTVEELNSIIEFAKNEAIMQSTPIGMVIEQHGYSFYRFIAKEAISEAEWQPLTQDRILSFRSLPSFIVMKLLVNKKWVLLPLHTYKNIPQIIIYPNGTLTPFILYLGEKNSDPLYQLEGHLNGTLTIKDLSLSNEK